MRYIALIVIAVLALFEFLVRVALILVMSLTLLPMLLLYDFVNPSMEELFRPYLLSYVEELIETREVVRMEKVDPTKALVDAYAEGKLTHEEFEDALTLTMGASRAG